MDIASVIILNMDIASVIILNMDIASVIILTMDIASVIILDMDIASVIILNMDIALVIILNSPNFFSDYGPASGCIFQKTSYVTNLKDRSEKKKEIYLINRLKRTCSCFLIGRCQSTLILMLHWLAM